MEIDPHEAIIFLIIALTCVISYRAFQNRQFFDQLAFKVAPILRKKQYHRLLTSKFVHTDWMHLAFNMLSFLVFALPAGDTLGISGLLIVYFVSGIAGSLLSLRAHRNQPEYSAVGASGGVAGIIFAAIILFPELRIGMFFIPGSIPGPVFAFIYVIIALFGVVTRAGRIGHHAHLGGALTGMLLASGLEPSVAFERWYLIIAITLFVLIFFLIWHRLPVLGDLQYPGQTGLALRMIAQEFNPLSIYASFKKNRRRQKFSIVKGSSNFKDESR